MRLAAGEDGDVGGGGGADAGEVHDDAAVPARAGRPTSSTVSPGPTWRVPGRPMPLRVSSTRSGACGTRRAPGLGHLVRGEPADDVDQHVGRCRR